MGVKYENCILFVGLNGEGTGSGHDEEERVYRSLCAYEILRDFNDVMSRTTGNTVRSPFNQGTSVLHPLACEWTRTIG